MPTETDMSGDALRLRALHRCLSDRNTGLLHEGLDSVCDLAENLPPTWPARDPLGRRDVDALPPELARPLAEAKALAIATGEAQTIELEVRSVPRRLFRAQLTPDREADGRVAGLFTILTDITESRERELAITSLLREVSHRSRNLLQIVQAVAMQTANHSQRGEDFLDKFRGRLQALASAQDLVTESNWRGTLFQSLVTAQLARIGQTSLRSIRIVGENPMLRPNAARYVGLALHELATNALLHGALSGRSPGTVCVNASVNRTVGLRRTLNVEWSEVTSGTLPGRDRHFGTVVLERIVPVSVGGSAHYDLQPDRVLYRLTIPASQFEA